MLSSGLPLLPTDPHAGTSGNQILPQFDRRPQVKTKPYPPKPSSIFNLSDFPDPATSVAV